MNRVSGAAWDEAAAAAGVAGACFICELVAGNPRFAHHVAYRDAGTIVFLNRYPWRWGHLLVAPAAHRERVVADVSMEEYTSLQRVLYAAARALEEYVDGDGLRVSTTGGGQGCRHVHWHVTPGGPDEPADPTAEVPDGPMAELAGKLRSRIRWLLAAGGATTPVVRR